VDLLLPHRRESVRAAGIGDGTIMGDR